MISTSRSVAVLILLITLPVHAQGTIEVRRGGKVIASNRAGANADLRVLFIGNSLTYWNEMPDMFKWVSESLGKKPYTRFSGGSGMSLRQHWEQGKAQKAIAEGPWDFVVLQGQSSEMMRDPAGTTNYARMFDEVIRRAGAKTVIMVTWWARDQKAVTERYLELARSLRARVAPIGIAMDELRQIGFDPYDSVHHPTLLGSYVSVCVLYATLYEKSPLGAKHRFDVKYDIHEVYREDLENEKIPAHVAETIQRKAWDVINR